MLLPQQESRANHRWRTVIFSWLPGLHFQQVLAHFQHGEGSRRKFTHRHQHHGEHRLLELPRARHKRESDPRRLPVRSLCEYYGWWCRVPLLSSSSKIAGIIKKSALARAILRHRLRWQGVRGWWLGSHQRRHTTSVRAHTSQERFGSSIERHPDASRFDVGFASMHAL